MSSTFLIPNKYYCSIKPLKMCNICIKLQQRVIYWILLLLLFPSEHRFQHWHDWFTHFYWKVLIKDVCEMLKKKYQINFQSISALFNSYCCKYIIIMIYWCCSYRWKNRNFLLLLRLIYHKLLKLENIILTI